MPHPESWMVPQGSEPGASYADLTSVAWNQRRKPSVLPHSRLIRSWTAFWSCG